MKPKSMSATAVKVFESCPARYVAETYRRTPTPGSSAADLGSVIHEALERWVTEGYHEKPSEPFATLTALYYEAYHERFEDAERFEEGKEILEGWYKRSHPLENEVLSVEVKENFEVPMPDGTPITFNYIWDRCDQLPNGEIEVVDYKSSSWPIQADDLRRNVQARCYSLAARIKYPSAPRIWVTFDMLRFDAVGVVFTKDDDAATWRYLKNVLARMDKVDTNDAPERLNPECRFCVRKHVCTTLQKHAAVGGVFSITDPEDAANRRAKLDVLKGTLSGMIDELDEFLLDHCRKNNLPEGFSTDLTNVKITASKRRNIDPRRAAKILGDEIMARYGNLRLGDIDKLLSGDEITDEQKRELRGLIDWKFGAPSIRTTEPPTLE